MARILSPLASTLALAASLSMAATPALAAPLPHSAASPASSPIASAAVPDALNWRGSSRRHHRHDRGIDGGDILAGALILGGIVAIASAASKSDRNTGRDDNYDYDENYRDNAPDYRPEYRGSSNGYTGNGMNNAVDICVDQVQRGNDYVDAVDDSRRTSDGWHISGRLQAGGGFSCWIDNSGRIRSVDVDDGSYGSSYGGSASYDSSYPGGPTAGYDNQYDDATYANARARVGTASPSYGGY